MYRWMGMDLLGLWEREVVALPWEVGRSSISAYLRLCVDWWRRCRGDMVRG